MNKLSETQPNVYQTYRESIDTEIELINKELLKSRLVIPEGFELYPKLLKEKWAIHFNNLMKYEVYVGHDSFSGGGPKSIYRTKTEGTKFSITAGKIDISSYDYNPSSNEFSVESTLSVYYLIQKHLDKIKKESFKKQDGKPLFYISLDDVQYYLNLTNNTFASEFWIKIVDIIESDRPVLSKVLKGYTFS